MSGQNQKENKGKVLYFEANQGLEAFDSFRLLKNDQKMLYVIGDQAQKLKKVHALINGTLKRYEKSLYKGYKYYVEDLQFILDKFPSNAPNLMKSLNIALNKQQSKVNVKCCNCGDITDVWRFCPTCEDAHYCKEDCQAKMKLTHQREHCKIRAFPKVYKPLQVQIHIGSDLGKNIHFCFQHEVSMSLLVRGQKLLDQLMSYLSTSEGNIVLDDYQAKSENNRIKFEKELTNPKVEQNKNDLKMENLDQIAKFYCENKTLQGLEIFLLQNGAILWKKIREIHNNYFREIFIFRYP